MAQLIRHHPGTQPTVVEERRHRLPVGVRHHPLERRIRLHQPEIPLEIASVPITPGVPASRLEILLSPAFALRLSLRIGPARAKDLLYTGRTLTADGALGIGLVDRVLDDTVGDAELATALEVWRGQPTVALHAARRAVDNSLAP